MTTARRVCLGMLTVCAPALSAAQVHTGPPGYRTLTPGAVAESLKVLAHLHRVVAQKPDSAAAWYRRGMLAWTLAARDNVPPPIRGLDWTLLGHMADTSLRIAAQLAPRRIEYQLAAGRYLASSFGALNRTAASMQNTQAIQRARTIADPALHASAALQAGRLYMRLYDSKEQRNSQDDDPMVREGLNPGASSVTPPTAQDVANILNHSLNTVDFSGEYFYLRAELLFDEAAKELPGSGDVFRAKAALFAARDRWTELTALGRMRVRDAAWDPWGWMALALGTYRNSDPKTPAEAFDSAMVRFDTASMRRIDQIERILRPADSVRLARLNPADRYATIRMYWLAADPLWSVSGNEPRLEFLARLAYAELRWTSDELGELGADTDRGRVYTRYGPPLVAVAERMVPSGAMLLTWMYSSVGGVKFQGYDYLNYVSYADVAALREMSPVQWNNINTVHVDSMPVQVARFRAHADSFDVFVAQRAPVAQLRAAAQIVAPPTAYLWMLRGGTVAVVSDSAPIRDSGVTSFTHRIANGDYMVRAEASAVGAGIATRSTGTVSSEPDSLKMFSPSGFGMSDVLLGVNAEPRTASPLRWTDFTIAPSAGVVRHGTALALLWENYDFAQNNGMAEYDVAIGIARERSQAGQISAGVLRGIAGAFGVNQQPDRTDITFARTVTHAQTMVDNIALSLGETPAGRYKLTVKVTDRITNRVTQWAGTVVVE